MPIEWKPYHMPFRAGIRSKPHPFVLDAPELTVCRDAYFSQTGALKTRFPFSALGTSVLSPGSPSTFGGYGTISRWRKIVSNGSELLAFSDVGLYSWDAHDSAWLFRGPHLAVSVQETTVFESTDDQYDTDRAELSGVVFYAWSNGTNAFVAMLDKATGATLAPPMTITGGSRPRLVACLTKVLFFVAVGGALLVQAFDPTALVNYTTPGSTLLVTTTVVANGTFNSYYDVVQVAGADQVVGACRNVTTTAHTLFTVTAGLTIATATPSRSCDGPIAVSSTGDGALVQTGRSVGTAISTDIVTISTLVDTAHVNISVGTATFSPVNQLGCAHANKSTGGANPNSYPCLFAWSCGENAASSSSRFLTQFGEVNTVGVANEAFILTPSGFNDCGVASRPFNYNGSVFAWIAFGQTSGVGGGAASTSATGAFQNLYGLVRISDAIGNNGFVSANYSGDYAIHAKAVMLKGGGLCPSTGRLPGVALTNGTTTFSTCLTVRRRVPLGPGVQGGLMLIAATFLGGRIAVQPTPSSSTMRAPQDVTFTFDSNDARRTARLGNTLYIAGGEVLQYDGNAITEVGFPIVPWWLDAATAGGGSVVNALYGYKSSYRWTNAQGEVDRSTSSVVMNATMSGGPQGFNITVINAPLTKKTSRTPYASMTDAAVELWRTVGNPNASSPLYLVTSITPGTSNPNAYIANSLLTGVSDLQTVNDQLSDANASKNQTFYENGAILPNIAPPAATIIIASDSRLFLGGVAGDADSIWYSKQRSVGEVAAFNDALTVPVPRVGGPITGLAFLNETLIVFRQTAIFALPGDGYDNAGGGQNYGPPKIISLDVGAQNPDSVVFSPLLGVMFKSNKGWYRLDRSWNLTYIGGPVNFADGDTVLSVNTVESQNQIRIVTNNRILVYTYVTDAIESGGYGAHQWAEWTISTGLHAAIWNGTYYYLDSSTGAMAEQSSYGSNATYGMDIETAWIKLADLQGFARIRRLTVLGEFRSSHTMQIRVARNYESDGAGSWNWYDNKSITLSGFTVGGALQIQHGPSRQQGEVFKIRITLTPSGSGDSATLVGVGFEVGVKPEIYKRLPVAQKV